MTMLTQNGMYESRKKEIFKAAWGFTKFAAFMGIVTISALAASHYSTKEKEARQLKESTIQKDLDQNGLDDMVIELSGGYKVPLFAIKQEGQIKYLSGTEMVKQYPESIVDYGRIEKRLND